MPDHWPSGERDTTQFPSVDITVSENLRNHLKAFLALEGVGWTDYSEQSSMSGLSVSDPRLRTYRKMYERLGLIYKENNHIRLSLLGKDIKNLEVQVVKEKDFFLERLRKQAVDILSRYQLKNPVEEISNLPDDCDVLPFLCIWKAMLSLDNKLHHEEMNRVILRIMKMTELEPAIERIRQARASLGSYETATAPNITTALGSPVHTNQPEARIAAWYSLAGWGGLIIKQQANADGFRHLVEEVFPLIDKVLANPPVFFATDNQDEWFAHYLGFASIERILPRFMIDLESTGLKYDSKLIARFIASCLSKQFVILTGLSGSGKTKLAQAFARWLTPKYQITDPFQVGALVQADRAKYLVTNADRISVEFVNTEVASSSETKVTLPRDLIQEWVRCIGENDFNRTTPVRTIREKVQETTLTYSRQLNSFETHLKAAAFATIESGFTIDVRHFEVIPVGADWTSNDNILGYADALDPGKYVKSQALELILQAARNPDLPYFLILDEMNLSHVERYFAAILSAIESSEPLIFHSDSEPRDDVPRALPRLPQNLFVVGTVNIDETTYIFSPKVLDRANVIEFTVSKEEIGAFLDNPRNVDFSTFDGRGVNFGSRFLNSAVTEVNIPEKVLETLKSELLLLFNLLKMNGLEFGFRTIMEITRFIYYHQKILGDTTWDFKDALDAQILQKILPKFHGPRKKLEPLLCALGAFCYYNHEWSEEGTILNSQELQERASAAAKYVDQNLHPLSTNDQGIFLFAVDEAFLPLSFEKIVRMLKLLELNGFASFAEA